MFSAYVLYSKHFNKIYIGFSSNVENRLSAHNDARNTGWTAKYKPWKIIHTEVFETKSEAMKREKQLKSYQGRVYIWDKLIPQINLK